MALRVLVVDYNVIGMAVEVRHPLHVGDRLAIDESFPAGLRAEVRHIRKGSGDCWLAGCEFSRPLTTADIVAMM